MSAPLPGPSCKPPKLTRPSPRPLLLSPCQNKAAACGLGSESPPEHLQLEALGCLEPSGKEKGKKTVLKL